MDIVNRLKFFMENQGIASSQFADSCKIPRPTLSQLLNGRNKKISDELIGKIHDAYPALSVLWLMFGEGEMMTSTNIQFSSPQKGINTSNDEAFTIDFQDDEYTDGVSSLIQDYGSNKFQNSKSGQSEINQPQANPVSQPNNIKMSAGGAEVSISPDSNKKITSIVVFYNDNSFQSFSPSI